MKTFRRHASIATASLALLTSVVGCEATAGSGDDFAQAYDSYLNKCASCHAPGAGGFVAGTESSLDFSTVDTARSSLRGSAKGLTGNQAACNDVPFVVAGKPEQSLLMATLDADVRKNLDISGKAGCDADGVSDMTIRVGGPDADAISKLRTWIADGAN